MWAFLAGINDEIIIEETFFKIKEGNVSENNKNIKLIFWEDIDINLLNYCKWIRFILYDVAGVPLESWKTDYLKSEQKEANKEYILNLHHENIICEMKSKII